MDYTTAGDLGSAYDSKGCKLPKPLVEKRRRARFNKSLEELKHLVPEMAHGAIRMDKADILEITVAHLKALQDECDNDTSHDPSYKDGFKRCIQETANAILSTPVPEDVKRHFISQLSVLNLGHDSYTPLTPEYDRAELCSPAKPHLTELPRHHPMAHQPVYPPPHHIHHSSSSAFAPHTSIKEEPRPFGSDNSGQFNIPQSVQLGQFNPQNGQSGQFNPGMPRIKTEVRSPEQQASSSSAEPGIWRPW